MRSWIGSRWRASAAASDDRGFTLVEVMAAGAVLSAVALGLVNAWAVMDRMSFDTLLRQKAVFVLNAEMERLATLYRTTSFGQGPRERTTGYPAVNNLTGGDTRLVYKMDSKGGRNAELVDFVTERANEFAASDDSVWLTGDRQSSRNYVWLDRGRNLAARISWTECEISANAASYCWDGTAAARAPVPPKLSNSNQQYFCTDFDNKDTGDRCRLIQLVLEYAFRVDVQGAAVTPVAAGGNRVLTLSTIVGRRFEKK